MAKLSVGNFSIDCVEETSVAPIQMPAIYIPLILGVDLVTDIEETGEEILVEVPRGRI